MLKKTILWWGCLWVLFAWGTLQAQDSIRHHYIDEFNDHLIPKTFINYRQLGFRISPKSRGETGIQYNPNVATTYGFGVVFKKLSVSFGLKFPQPAIEQTNKGDSKYLDFQINSFGRRFGYDIIYQDYKGYYIENPGSVLPNWGGGSVFPQRNDLHLLNISANFNYIFNPNKFSYRSIFIFDERQLRSAGSFILTGSANYLTIRADSSLIPTQTNLNFDRIDDFSKGNFFGIAVAPGYAYNLILFRSIFFSLGLTATFGLQFQEYGLNNFSRQYLGLLFKFLARAAIGYNGKRFFIGISGFIDGTTLALDKNSISANTSNWSIFLGYRFKTKLLSGKKIF